MVEADSDDDTMYEERIESSKKDEITDLYDLTEWEPRTLFDKFCVLFNISSHFLIAAGFLISVTIVLLTILLSFLFSPILAVFLLGSAVPAFFAVWYIWETDPYEKVPATLIITTFLLCCLLVTVPLTINTATIRYFRAVPGGMALFFFFVVAPLEETVKWLSVRLYGYDQDIFNSAIDGAVLGAVAGLAFAVMENAIYISGAGFLGAGGAKELTLGRAGVAPLHVMWSGIAGYYLGLAKLNREYARTLMFKGLIVAIILHGTYNTAVAYNSEMAESLAIPALGVANTERLILGVFLLGFYSLVAYYAVKKLNVYRKYTIQQEETEDIRNVIAMSDDEIDRFLQSHPIGVLSLSQEYESYSVPMSYGYDPDDRFLCLMMAYGPGSKKREWVRNTETVSFAVHNIEGHEAESVLIRGSLTELIKKDELESGYDALSKNALFTVPHLSGAREEDTDFEMYRIDIESITGRKFKYDLEKQIEGNIPGEGVHDIEG